MPTRPLILATRQSPLALRQAEAVAAALQTHLPDTAVELLTLTTTGDQRRDWSLVQAGGKGLFTKELEDALLDRRADLAVHSAKDLPGEMPLGLELAGCLPREDPRDCLITRTELGGAPQRIATSSPRRQAQLARRFPEATWTEIRGNVATRLRKIAEGVADATVLAMAGINRLGISAWPGLSFEPLSLDEVVPAPGQAAIAIQCRAGEAEIFSPVLDRTTSDQLHLERRLLRHWDGGCKTPFGALVHDDTLRIFHDRLGFHKADLSAKARADREAEVLTLAKAWDADAPAKELKSSE